MMGFLLSLKQNCPRNKTLATFLLHIFQIQLILSLLLTLKAALYQDASKFIFHSAQVNSQMIDLGILVFNLIILGLTAQQGNSNSKSILYQKMIHTFTIKFVKMFPYIGFIPMVFYSLTSIRDQQIQYKIIAGFNIISAIAFSSLNQISNWAYRFIEVDYCNQRNSNQFSIALVLVYLSVSILFSPLYASFVILARGLFKLLFIYQHYDYPLIQKINLFYGLFTVYLFLVAFGTSFFTLNVMESFRQFTLLSLFALFISSISLNPILFRLNQERIKNSSQITLMDKDQCESMPDNLSKKIEEAENVLRILTHVFLEKLKMEESEPSEYSKWWQIFNRVVMIHRIQCERPSCACNTIKKNPKAESMIYIIEMLKMSESLYLLNTKMYNLKIMSIYLFIEIAKKPLKAYYEIMRLKQQKINSDTDLELEYLIKETRECFDQVFLKNKAKNQELELLKVIEYEELMINLNKNLDEIIEKVINFHELFLYSTIKTSSVKAESALIFEKKKMLEDQVYNIIANYSENTRLNLIIFVFYRYLEVYKSNESELKKISSQKLLKKRIYQKKEANIFNPEFGSIYIDLVEERGKILNITSNMCEAFGYTREEMIAFNIRRYMPTIFSRNHDRFLSNFVEKGKIKLLKQRERVIFAKNKNKFIFPVNVRLKAEYLLQNQFGSSSLINTVETNSEFMMVGSNGKLQELTESIYKKTFGTVFREEVIKCNRLSAFKLLPSLNRIYDPSEEEPFKMNRIYEGVLLYSLSEELLIEKFRYAREMSMSGGKTAGTSITGSQSGAKMSIMSVATNISNNGMPQSEITDFLTETFKTFLVDVNIFKLKGQKVSYKLSQIHTSEFKLTLIEFITFEPIEGVPFYNAVLSEFRNVSQIYQLNEEHGPIAVHLNEIEEVIRQNRYHKYLLAPIPQNQNKVDLTNAVDYEGEVERKRESYTRNRTMDNKHFDVLQMENGSDKSLVGEDVIKKQAYQEYERSEQSSVLENTESESKKQILINAFNSKDSAVSKKTMCGINLVIAGLIVLLILLSVFSISYVYENQQLWMDVSFILTTNQVIGFKIALLETEIFQREVSGETSSFIKEKKVTSIEKLKKNMEDINKNTIESSLAEGFYTQKVLMFNAESNKSSQVALAEFLNRYLYMLMYESEKNIEELRNNYGQMVLIFDKLEREKFGAIYQISEWNFKLILIFLSLYMFFLLLANVLIIPIYTYYKNQENNIIGLLSYMNIREIKRSIYKLKQIKDLIKSKQSNINNLYSLVPQNTNQKKLERQKSYDMEAQVAKKTLKISSEHDTTSIKLFKIICILLFLIIFLSNFAAASFYITFTAEKYFMSNLKSCKLIFKFQNKSPLLINTLLANVNRHLNNKPIITYPDSVYQQGGQDFFAPAQEMSKVEYKGSKISQLTKQMFSSKLCEEVIQCKSTSSYTKSTELSFEYLVYLFKEKFAILLPEDKYSLTSASIAEWIEENRIENYMLWLEEMLTMAKSMNAKIDGFFTEDEKDLRVKLLICALVLIPINIVLIVYARTRFLRFLNEMLMESEDIFRHFNVAVLVENTYLTSYFNSKIKQNK